MGKQITSQKRGRGTTTYRSHSFRWAGKANHRNYDEAEKTSSMKGTITDFIHSAGHTSPLAIVNYDNGEKAMTIAPDNMKVSDIVYSGEKAPAEKGNTLPLKHIPEGTTIFNVELRPGDGGVFCRASGTFAKIISVHEAGVTIELPSKKTKLLSADCRATIGIPAGSGRLEKPLLKAGKVHHMMRAKGKLYPRTSAVAMNAVDHPFGSGRGRHIGKPKTAPRFAPPGRKVGLVRARRTGRKK